MTGLRDSFVADRLPPPEDLPEFLFELPELRYPERLNAASALIDRHNTADLALVSEEGSWTYGEIRALAGRIANILVADGLVPGNRVLLRGPNGAMLFAAWLAVLKAGGVAVATMPMLRAGEVAHVVEKAAISHAIVDTAGLEAVRPALAGLKSLLVYDGDQGKAFEQRLRDCAPDFAAADTASDDPALIAFTSGTTGAPKGCIQFHRDILAAADAFSARILKPRPGMRWLCSAPIAFTFGLGQSLIFPWASGGAAVIASAPGPAALLDAVDRHGANILATAPTAYKALLGLIGGRDISSLVTCVSAGEHLPEAVWRAWKEATGLAIVDGIGATEMMHIFISAAGGDIRPGATGRPVPGYRACLLDEDGLEMTTGTGRLAVKGPTGCRYLDDPRQKAYVVNGWNVTGDTYRADDQGYFWFVARSDDMIISAGYNIAAPEVENALLSHAAVQECAVIGVADEERGQRVKAFVVVAPGAQANEELVERLKTHVKAAIAPYKYPREIAFVDALPKTATGKLQRYALRDKP